MNKISCSFALGLLLLCFYTSMVAANGVIKSKKYLVHFGILRCIKTEESSDDEIYLYRYEDGNYEEPWLKWYEASPGDYHRFNAFGTFDKSYQIDVWDYDWGSRDEYIGSVWINEQTIEREYMRMNRNNGDYSLTWTNLTPHRNTLLRSHSEKIRNRPSRDRMTEYRSNVNLGSARDGHRDLRNHIHHRRHEAHSALQKTVHTFKKTDATQREKNEAVEQLKRVLGYTPLRGIVKNIDDGVWPTVIIYGVTTSVNFVFASFNIAYGIALQTDGSKAALVIGFNTDLGITVGDEGKIGIGINRNDIENVPGWTYGYTATSYEQLTGGITFSFDLKPHAPDLQEITYTWSPLPAGRSVGYTYTVAKGKNY